MKLLCTLVLFWLSILAAHSQTINSVTISPTYPTENDSILIITDITYQGACSYGIVYSYDWTDGDTIHVYPTYCGYWDTTWCNNLVDTVTIAPRPMGSYVINIEYHQGSVCPISGFDATIGQHYATVEVSQAIGIIVSAKTNFKVYPNPAAKTINIICAEYIGNTLQIHNSLGQLVYQTEMNKPQLRIDTGVLGGSGLYLLSANTGDGLVEQMNLIVR